MGAGQAGRRTAEHDSQRSGSHGKGQVAQVARWLATLKASGCLCLLDVLGNEKAAESKSFSPQIIDARLIFFGIRTENSE